MRLDFLSDPVDLDLHKTYLIINALDKCVTNLLELLESAAKQLSASARVE
jgi:hypothetical protein